MARPLPTSGRSSTHVVGFGASAGGLEALQALLPHLPATGCVSYLIAQHMAHDGHSELLLGLLGRASPLDTVLARDGDPLQADRISLIPAGHDGRVRDGRIRLQPPSEAALSTPSVDVLFSSIAEALGTRGAGILLSGTGSDGVAGCRAIKSAGGITIAQDPTRSTFDGMPTAAIRTGAILEVLPEAAIPAALMARWPEVPSGRPPASLATPPGPGPTGPRERLLPMVLAATGYDFTGYKEETLQRRLERRLEALGLEDPEAYLDLAARTPAELGVLAHQFLVSLSSFFRDRASFRAVEDALRTLVAVKRPGEPIRVWVPGCASGEEAYTLAIILSEVLGPAGSRRDVTVTGTDLAPDVLEQARAGLFRPRVLGEMEAALRDRYLVPQGEGYRVHEAVRSMCEFRRHDLVRAAPLTALDMVSCRNLLIYLKAPLQDRVIRTFHDSLLPRGLLFIAPSESIGLKGNALFTPVDRAHNLFRRR